MKLDYLHFSGSLKFNNEDCAFRFDDYCLTIEISDIKNFNPFDNTTPLNFDSLFGNISTFPNYVFFFFGKNAYRKSFQSKGYTCFNITIYIKYFIVLDKPFNGKDVKISFENNSFQKWLSVYPIYEGKNYFSAPSKIKINKSGATKKSRFTYKGKEYVAMPGYQLHFSQTTYNFKSTFDIECVNSVTEEDVFNLSLLMIDILKFTFYRNSVDLGEIKIKSKIVVDGKTYYEKIGQLFFQYSSKEFESIDLNKILDFGFIPWALFYSKIANLVQTIESNKIYLNYLPEKRKERFMIDISSIFSISAAFESEFKECFPKFKTYKLSDANCKKLLEKVDNLKLNQHQIEIKNNMTSFLKTSSLSERFEYALNRYGSIVQEIIGEKNSLDYKAIIKSFREARNKVDHGDLDFKVSEETANVFFYTRILILCMQLTRMKIRKDKLVNYIRPVLSVDCNR